MGTEYSFLCLDCMEYWDMGRGENAIHFFPELRRQHFTHRSLIVSREQELDSLFSPYYLHLSGLKSPYIRKDCFTELKATEESMQDDSEGSPATYIRKLYPHLSDEHVLGQAYQEVLEKTIEFSAEQQQKGGIG